MPEEHRDHLSVWPHEALAVKAEALRVSLALAPFGVLSRDALARESGAEHWHRGGFDLALSAAIAEGLIEELSGGFYRDRFPRRAAGDDQREE